MATKQTEQRPDQIPEDVWNRLTAQQRSAVAGLLASGATVHQGSGGFLGLGLIPQEIEQAKGTKNIENLFKGLTGKGAPAAKADPKKAAASSTTEADALKQLAQWLTTNYTEQGALAMGQQGQQLAQQNQYVTSLVDQQMQQAGAASGNPAVAAAMDAYTKAYSGGEALNSLGYANMGAANQQYLQESPLSPIANLLTQNFGSTYYKQLPPSLVQGLPTNVQQALAQAGVTESSPTGGSAGTPIPTTKGAASGAANLAQIIAGLSNTTNPSNPLSAQNQTLTPGTASNPTS